MSKRRKSGCFGDAGCGCLILLIVLAIIGWIGQRWGDVAANSGLLFLVALIVYGSWVSFVHWRPVQRLRGDWRRSFGEGRQPIPQWMRDKILERDDYRCRYCGRRAQTLDIDHVIPVSQGGKTIMSNLVTACSRCNRQKAGRTPRQAGMRIRRP